MEAEEFLGFLFAAGYEALLLNSEVAKFVFGFDASEAIEFDGVKVGGVGVCCCDAFAAGQEGCVFKRGHSLQTPSRINDVLDVVGFDDIGRLEFGSEAGGEGVELIAIFAGEEENSAGEAVFYGVLRDFVAVFRGWTGAALSVGAIGRELGFGDERLRGSLRRGLGRFFVEEGDTDGAIWVGAGETFGGVAGAFVVEEFDELFLGELI